MFVICHDLSLCIKKFNLIFFSIMKTITVSYKFSNVRAVPAVREIRIECVCIVGFKNDALFELSCFACVIQSFPGPGLDPSIDNIKPTVQSCKIAKKNPTCDKER